MPSASPSVLQVQEAAIARFGLRFWRWPLGVAVLAAIAVGLVHPLPVGSWELSEALGRGEVSPGEERPAEVPPAEVTPAEVPPAEVPPAEVVASFADEPVDAPADVIEAGLGRRLAGWQYTFAMLPPDLRRFCVGNDLGSADCRVVTHVAPLRERGLQIRFEEDDQGFLAMVHVHPFSRWRIGGIPDG